uniref:Uncharacterized protein n=1 Tax=viral metagenome TaxID=1070528 RepID=A0A6H2A472_9ZZZZ
MKNYDPIERDNDTQACRNLWAEVLNNAMDLAGKIPKHPDEIQNRRFIAERTGTFTWICNQLDLDPVITSKAMISAIEA